MPDVLSPLGNVETRLDNLDFGGWAYWFDSVHTDVSPQTITAGTRTLLTVDGLGTTTELSNLHTVPSTVWDTSTSTMQPTAVGEEYDVRVAFTAIPTTVSQGEYLTLELDIGSGSQINIITETLPLLKGSGVNNVFSRPLDVFCLTTFNTNGGKFYVTPSVNMDLHSKSIKISRKFKPHAS